MNPTVTGRPRRVASSRPVSKHSAAARESLDPRCGEQDGVAGQQPRVLEPRCQHVDDALIGPQWLGEHGPRERDAVKPLGEPGAHVESGGEHDGHDDRIGDADVLRQRGCDIAVPRIDETDGNVQLRTSRGDRIDERDDGGAVVSGWRSVRHREQHEWRPESLPLVVGRSPVHCLPPSLRRRP